ncbi:MAG: DUF488 domain-containing protein [Parcubacteria group bacterium]|jgi:uncharacterized protein YeaO (DUF488 family)
MIKLKRIYEKYEKADGFRILVDRLWPRGVSKEKARLDLWLKDIAPSTNLRKWFAHDPRKWAAFQKRYAAELTANNSAVQELQKIAKANKNITLLFAARDERHNEAIVIKDFLEKK